jgi:hypothetical protein
MKQIGKKGKEWIKARVVLIKEALLNGKIIINKGVPEGRCEICKEWKTLDPDHIKKRSQGGEHTTENIRWICRKCHNKVDNMPDSKKGNKSDWQKPHICVNCKTQTSQFICHVCGRISVKTTVKRTGK